MDFVKNYKKGGDREEKTGKLGGYLYLSKKDELDVDFKVVKAFVLKSENPKTKGHEKFIVVLEPVEIRTAGQCEPDGNGKPFDIGSQVSYKVNLTKPGNEPAETKAFEEMVEVLSGLTGVSPHKYFTSVSQTTAKKQSLIEKHLEDDCAVAQGNIVTVATEGDANDAGWFNLSWTFKDGQKAKAAA